MATIVLVIGTDGRSRGRSVDRMSKGGRAVRKGSYLLALHLEKEEEMVIGALGPVFFPAGIYVYAGSGQSSLHARVGRHFASSRKEHWHIDYLLGRAKSVAALLFEGEDQECSLNQMVADVPGSECTCPGFGSSDCHCRSHLYRVTEEGLARLFFLSNALDQDPMESGRAKRNR